MTTVNGVSGTLSRVKYPSGSVRTLRASPSMDTVARTTLKPSTEGQLDREVSDVSISELKFGRGCGFAGVFAYFDAIIAFGEVGEFKF